MTVTLQGAGRGKVTDGAGTLSCTVGKCSQSYRPGAVVRLYAGADAGSTFGGWSVEGCGSQNWCDVILNGDTKVTATFNATPYTLDVTIRGDGAVNATGLSCSGASCSGIYYYNTTVSITATPTTPGRLSIMDGLQLY